MNKIRKIVIFPSTFNILIIIMFMSTPVNAKVATRQVDTPQSSAPLKKLYSSLYNVWNYSHNPLDLSFLHTFPNCLIIVTNFISADFLQLRKSVIIRKPIPVIFSENQTAISLGWVLENRAGYLQIINSSCFPDSNIYDKYYSQRPAGCEQFDLWQLAMKSSNWNCEIRTDLLPPNLNNMLTDQQLRRSFEQLELQIRDLEYPNLWSYNIKLQNLDEIGGFERALTSQTPIINMFVVMDHGLPKIPHQWIWAGLYGKISSTINIGFFIIEFLEIDKVYQVSILRCIRHHSTLKYSLITYTSAEIGADAMYDLLEYSWKTQMLYESNYRLGMYHTYLDLCSSKRPGLERSLFVIRDALLSILRNSTFGRQCSTTKNNYIDVGFPLARITITNQIEQLLHYPMYTLNPFNGSYRFVVCGMRGSESLAFQDLISVYDMYVWKFILIFVLSLAFTFDILATNNAKPHRFVSILGKIDSNLKILLEQGIILKVDKTGSHQNVRILLAIYLAMGVVLSNGFKNSNVYKMVSPRKPVRYGTFESLVQDKVTIYVISHGNIDMTSDVDLLQWFEGNISQKIVAPSEVVYYNDNPNQPILTATMNLPQPRTTVVQWSWKGRSDKGNAFHEMIRSNCMVHFGGVLQKWVERYQKKNQNWPEIMRDEFFVLHQQFFNFLNGEYADIEKEFLFDSLNKCNRTAVLLYSMEAESFARRLTLARGNTGRETYFQRYFAFEMSGLVSPEILSRLSRIKGSGLIEWWANITEHILLTKLLTHTSTPMPPLPNHPTRTSLSGNIIVLFYVIICGLVLGSLLMFVELVWKHGRVIFASGFKKEYIRKILVESR